MNTPAQCGAIKPPKTDIYSEAPHLGPGPAPATIPEHPLAIRGLNPHHHLPPLLANAGHLETVRAEPHRSTNLNHQGPPASWIM